MPKKIKLNQKEQKKVLSFMNIRFLELQQARQDLDIEILEEIDLYNDIDKNQKDYDAATNQKGKKWWETKATVPYLYTIVQTMVARLIQAFFGKQNYLKIYIEDRDYKKVEPQMQLWLQAEMDKIGLKARARDFIEESLVERTSWLQLRPVMTKGNKLKKIDFNVYSWFDVWFDTRAVKTTESDYFIRDIITMRKLHENKDEYMNLDKLKKSSFPASVDESNEQEKYEAKQSSGGEEKVAATHPFTGSSVIQEVEVMRYHGWYDFGTDEKPDYKPVIFSWGNRQQLLRAEEVDIETERKHFIFNINPMRQANSLIGKSPGQVVKTLQYLLNEVVSQMLDNYKLSVKLLFKYKKDASIDQKELMAAGGNAISYEDNPEDISTFTIPNMVDVALAIISQVIQWMQQTTGAVDFLMGTSAARGVNETARGTAIITEQAMFKFHMMGENVYGSLKDIVKYTMIFWKKYNPEEVLKIYPELTEFFNQTVQELEESRVVDIGMNDLTLRRDAERTSFINAMNIIAGLLEGVPEAKPKELLREVMSKLEMERIEDILGETGPATPAAPPDPAAALTEILKATTGEAPPGSPEAQRNQKRGGSPLASPKAKKGGDVDAQVNNITPEGPGGV